MPNIDGMCKSSAREFAESNCSARDVQDSSHSMWLASTGAHTRGTSHANAANATSCPATPLSAPDTDERVSTDPYQTGSLISRLLKE